MTTKTETKSKRGNPKPQKYAYRNTERQLVLAKHRFHEGETPEPADEESKGDIKALIQGITVGINTEEITAKSLLDMETAYLEYIYESKTYIIPDIDGFCTFCGITRYRLDKCRDNMKREPCIDPFGNECQASQSDVVQKIKQDFLSVKKQLGLEGKIPTVAFVATMNNEGDWTTKSELVLTPQNPIETQSSAELDKMIDDYKSDAIEGKVEEK